MGRIYSLLVAAAAGAVTRARSCHAACHFLNCSRTTKVMIVWGPRRIKAGVQPLKNEAMPSALYIWAIIDKADISPAPPADMIRVLITSTGEHTVVATKPYHPWISISLFLLLSNNTYCKHTGRKMNSQTILQGAITKQKILENVIRNTLRRSHQDSSVDIGTNTTEKRSNAFFTRHTHHTIQSMLIVSALLRW